MSSRWTLLKVGLAVACLAAGPVWGAGQQVAVQARPGATGSTISASNPSPGAPALRNGKLQIRGLVGNLSEDLHAWAAATSKAEWLGYSVAEAAGDHSVCCESWSDGKTGRQRCGGCRLESTNYDTNASLLEDDRREIHLEGPRELVVLYRAEFGKITKIRIFSLDCTVDAGGLTVHWLQNVGPQESVSLLTKLIHQTNFTPHRDENLAQEALTALALHADASADRALESLVALDQPVPIRKEVSFWLGEARGAEGLAILQKMAKGDPAPEVREQVPFALSLSQEPGALPEMIRMAHQDSSSKVRSQALFWLGQKAGAKAAAAISGSIDEDPDTEVKKKAVFALSQMPADQGIGKLIEVAETNHNPQVRKEAIFWLGQSENPQALAFFEKVLTR